MSVKILSVFQEPAREEKELAADFFLSIHAGRVFSHSKGFGAMQS